MLPSGADDGSGYVPAENQASLEAFLSPGYSGMMFEFTDADGDVISILPSGTTYVSSCGEVVGQFSGFDADSLRYRVGAGGGFVPAGQDVALQAWLQRVLPEASGDSHSAPVSRRRGGG